MRSSVKAYGILSPKKFPLLLVARHTYGKTPLLKMVLAWDAGPREINRELTRKRFPCWLAYNSVRGA